MIISMRCKVKVKVKSKMKIRFNLSIKNSVNSESTTIMGIKINRKIKKTNTIKRSRIIMEIRKIDKEIIRKGVRKRKRKIKIILKIDNRKGHLEVMVKNRTKNSRIVQNKINMMKMKMILNNSSKTKITKSKVMNS